MVSVTTAGEVCKKCYSCVRSCPTKALQVLGGQAEIIEDVCISCGACVTACSQGAKRVVSSLDDVRALLAGEAPVYALLAPSFPAAFLEWAPERLVGALHAAGFRGVYEAALGADLVAAEYARRYRALLETGSRDFVISSPCPAVVQYVEKVLPELTPHLAPVVSPMRAAARVARAAHGEEPARVVFIGPCVAKKVEGWRSEDVDAVLTFPELVELFASRGIDPAGAAPGAFQPPHAGMGRIYPVTGGLLKAAGIDDDILDSPVYVVEGAQRVIDILGVLSRRVRTNGPVTYRLFDLLFCEGCIGGPAMANDLTFFERKKYIVRYIKARAGAAVRHGEAAPAIPAVELSTGFTPIVREQLGASEEQIRCILALTGKNTPADELNCGACGYASCRDKAVAVYFGKAEVEMCLPYLISRFERAMADLTANQQKLIQAEKLASMGQMAAGIAHEINNPLGVVLMYAHLLKDELSEAAAGASPSAGLQDVDRIITEAERTRGIVRGILDFAREDRVARAPADLNALLREAVAAVLAATPRGLVRVEESLDPGLGPQMVDASQVRQVFDNLLRNAVEAMPGGGTLRIGTAGGNGETVITVADSGPGIPPENLPRLFMPFFTTKKVGEGTGLGLSVCYGIVKMHGGTIQASNVAGGGGACFTVRLRRVHKEDVGGSTSHR